MPSYHIAIEATAYRTVFPNREIVPMLSTHPLECFWARDNLYLSSSLN